MALRIITSIYVLWAIYQPKILKMKKSLTLLTLTMLMLYGCTKKEIIHTQPKANLITSESTFNANPMSNNLSSYSSIDSIGYWSDKLMYDESFANFVYAYLDNASMMRTYFAQTLGSNYQSVYNQAVNGNLTDEQLYNLYVQYGLNTDYIKSISQDIFAYGCMFFKDNQGFFDLSSSQQTVVMNNVLPEYLLNNGGSAQLLTTKSKIKEKFKKEKKDGINDIRFDLTWGEFVGCAVGTVVDFFAGNVGSIRTLWAALRGEFTSIIAIKAGLSLFGNAVGGWWTLGMTALKLGACLFAAGVA